MMRLDLRNPTFLESRKSKSQPVKNIESHISFIKTPINAQCFVSVVIPARDEAENLQKTLDSFASQVNFQNLPLDTDIFEVMVLINNCRDNSAEIVENWKSNNPHFNLFHEQINLPEENANIGFVRRLLMNEAFHRLKSNKFGVGIIATTDSDSCVAPDWIANIVNEIENGADAVGGRILIDENEIENMDEKARRFHLLDEEYRMLTAELEDFFDGLPHDPNPRHHQHFNGSFAVTTDAFNRAGGIPKVKFLEDAAFYSALSRIDAKFRHSTEVKVFTSARNQGRTALGLSTQLNEWQIMGENGDFYLVESARTIKKRLSARRRLRNLWQKAQTKFSFDANIIQDIAEQICVSEATIFNSLKSSRTFGFFLEKVSDEQNSNDQWKRNNPLVPVENAIFELRTELEEIRIADKSRKKTA